MTHSGFEAGQRIVGRGGEGDLVRFEILLKVKFEVMFADDLVIFPAEHAGPGAVGGADDAVGGDDVLKVEALVPGAVALDRALGDQPFEIGIEVA